MRSLGNYISESIFDVDGNIEHVEYSAVLKQMRDAAIGSRKGGTAGIELINSGVLDDLFTEKLLQLNKNDFYWEFRSSVCPDRGFYYLYPLKKDLDGLPVMMVTFTLPSVDIYFKIRKPQKSKNIFTPSNYKRIINIFIKEGFTSIRSFDEKCEAYEKVG